VRTHSARVVFGWGNMAGFPNTVDKLACVQMCDRCAAGAAPADAHLHTRRIRRLVLRSGGGAVAVISAQPPVAVLSRTV
jgi:hypothetical protein